MHIGRFVLALVLVLNACTFVYVVGVKSVKPLGNGMMRVRRTETPGDARKRLMQKPLDQLTKEDALSFHSAIPANSEHSRKAVAYDLAIGQAKSIDDEAFYTYLCRIADWRLGWDAKKNAQRGGRADGDAEIASDEIDGPNDETLAFFKEVGPENEALIRATADYRATGQPNKYPQYFAPDLPSLIRSETRGEVASQPKNNREYTLG